MAGHTTSKHSVRKDRRRDKLIAQLATGLGFEILETRGVDRLDFREVFVESIQDVLARAYEAGREAGRAGR